MKGGSIRGGARHDMMRPRGRARPCAALRARSRLGRPATPSTPRAASQASVRTGPGGAPARSGGTAARPRPTRRSPTGGGTCVAAAIPSPSLPCLARLTVGRHTRQSSTWCCTPVSCGWAGGHPAGGARVSMPTVRREGSSSARAGRPPARARACVRLDQDAPSLPGSASRRVPVLPHQVRNGSIYNHRVGVAGHGPGDQPRPGTAEKSSVAPVYRARTYHAFLNSPCQPHADDRPAILKDGFQRKFIHR